MCGKDDHSWDNRGPSYDRNPERKHVGGRKNTFSFQGGGHLEVKACERHRRQRGHLKNHASHDHHGTDVEWIAEIFCQSEFLYNYLSPI